MAGLKAWKESRDWIKQEGEFIPAPLVWLRNRRWESILEAIAAEPVEELLTTTRRIQP